MAALADLPEWRALEAHAATRRRARPARRCSPPTRRAATACTSRPRAGTSTTRSTGSPTRRCGCSSALAEARGWRSRVDAMFRGEHVNVTEDRPVLHVALRMPARRVARGRRRRRRRRGARGAATRWRRSRTQVRDGTWRGHTGRRDPQRREHRHRRQRPRARDGVRRAARLQPARRCSSGSCRTSTAPISSTRCDGLDAAETLFVVSSKTFTTLETITNAHVGARSGCSTRSAATRPRSRALRRGVDQRGRRSRSSASTPRTCSSSGTGSAVATRCGRRSACR